MVLTDKPIPGSYWVLAGRLLAGEYPASRDEASTRLILAAFLAAGFDTFLDLTNPDERPNYEPLLQAEAHRLARRVDYRRFAFPDFSVPDPLAMTDALDALDAALGRGAKVYLHCVGGIGRTGMTVGCYLVRHGRGGRQALEELSSMYRTSAQSAFSPLSPENGRQAAFVRDWRE